MKLSGKVALLTGAGQGMGRAIARLFAEEGATVVAVDLNLAAAEETIGAADPDGGSIARSANVADSAAVSAVFEEATKKCGRINIVVNSAGIGSLDTPTETADESWARDGVWYFRRRLPCYWYATDLNKPPIGDMKMRWPGRAPYSGTFHELFPSWKEFWAERRDKGSLPQVAPPAPLEKFLETMRRGTPAPRIRVR